MQEISFIIIFILLAHVSLKAPYLNWQQGLQRTHSCVVLFFSTIIIP